MSKVRYVNPNNPTLINVFILIIITIHELYN